MSLVDRIAEMVHDTHTHTREIAYSNLPELSREHDRGLAKRVIEAVLDEIIGKTTPPHIDKPIVPMHGSLVRSESDPRITYITITHPDLWCSCPAWRYRAPAPCKHIQEALAAPDSALLRHFPELGQVTPNDIDEAMRR